MKLWKKISLLTAVVLFLAMGIFGGGMLYETWKYNLNQTVSSYQQQIKVNAYVIAQEINNNPLSRFSEVTRKSFLNYTVQKYGGTDYILLKNGTLTDQEYEIIKTHPRNGADLLSVISQFRPILPAILSHHERIDGSGYPDGLRGDDIPEQARIIAVADTFDAMTSDRQYRKGLGFRKAMDELSRCKGSQLDAHITEVFQSMVQEPDFRDKMREEIQDRAPCQIVSD